MEQELKAKGIRIAVCDDIPDMTQSLMGMIQEITEEHDVVCDLIAFSSGIDLLKSIQEIDLVFLDIEMPGFDGIETGEHIMEVKPACKVVIASGREDRIKETFKIKAMRFVSKPYDKDEVQEALEACLDTITIGMGKVEVFRNRQAYQIMQREIQYIKADNGAVCIVARNTEFRKEITLSKLEEGLDERLFFKIHKAVIVGLLHVTDYSEKTVSVGEAELALSRRNRSEFEKTFIDFDLKYRG